MCVWGRGISKGDGGPGGECRPCHLATHLGRPVREQVPGRWRLCASTSGLSPSLICAGPSPAPDATGAESRLTLHPLTPARPLVTVPARLYYHTPGGGIRPTSVTTGTTCGRWSVTHSRLAAVARMLSGGVEPDAPRPASRHPPPPHQSLDGVLSIAVHSSI